MRFFYPVLLLAACSPELGFRADALAPVTVAAPQLERYARFERSFPGAADLTATFTSPSGAVVKARGFSTGAATAVRFTPGELGEYAWSVKTSGGDELASGRFVSVASTRRGFVRRTGAHLQLDDGSPFIILGENRINIYDPSWNYAQKGIADYVAYMASLGMNTVRVFVYTDNENEERPDRRQLGCLEPQLGLFDPVEAARYDELFDAAEANGVYVVLTVFALGFTPSPDTWKSWDDNPYGQTLGGPADDQYAFFDYPPLRPLAKRRLQYVQNRWGSSPALLAVDLLNEPEWDGTIAEATWIPWAEDLSDAWRAMDPYRHLVTVGSVGLHWNLQGDERPWYGSDKNDLVQWHLYGSDWYDPWLLAGEMTRKVRETNAYGKPVFVGEFAYGGEDKATYDHTHDGIWSAVFAGGGAVAHSAPQFNIDSDELMTPERGAHFKTLRAFLERFTGQLEPVTPDLVAAPNGARAWELRGDRQRALWLLGPHTGYGSAVSGGSVTVSDLEPGTWKLEWVDDVSGVTLSSEEMPLGASTTLSAPTFTRHLAARLTRTGP